MDVDTSETVANPTSLSTKLVTLLSPESHYFTTLWPVIISQADTETQRVLGKTCAWLHLLVLEATIRRRSDRLKDSYVEGDQRPKYTGSKFACPNPLRLRNDAVHPLWYQWGANKCGFKSTAGFYEFCKLAGVDEPDKAPGGVNWVRAEGMPEIGVAAWISYSFLSSAGDVHFVCYEDPRVPANEGYVHYLGCTGEYAKTKRLEEWFKKNGQASEMCKWVRYFI